MKKQIWTIGHSTRGMQDFAELLQEYKIEILADVRSFPGSRKFPHFNKESLERSMPKLSIDYIHFPELGGRRKAVKNSKNDAWKNEAFRGYADYMETEEFRKGIERLEKTAAKRKTAYMCSEAVWWRCHRSMISDYLKSKGWTVLHIMDLHKVQEHPYTSPARVIQGTLDYSTRPGKEDAG
ncbi:MAG: DUF488 family protein [Cytophagaceae bacterium]